MADKPGYIALYRKIQENFLWQEKREFSKLEAWLDILMEVRWKDEPEEVLIGNQILRCGYGESLKSLETWAGRWKWSKSKVKRVLDLFVSCSMIEMKNETVTTRIRVRNYEKYQKLRNADETQMKRKRNASETQVEPEEEGNNLIRKEERIKEYARSRKKTCSKLPSISLDLENFTWENITEKDREDWRMAYPACSIEIELKKAALWVKANPTKVKKNWLKFITNWLNRSQECGGTRGKPQSTSRELTWAERRALEDEKEQSDDKRAVPRFH